MRADLPAASSVHMAQSLRLAPQRGRTVTASCKQEGGRFSVSSHKCGGKSPSITLVNHAAINSTVRVEGKEKAAGLLRGA